MKHTKESKEKLSKSRKEYFKNNPDAHVWKRHSKFKSVPCEKFKNVLKENDITFIEEYQPLVPDYFYSIDVAFPNKKFGIEINGNQHYNADGTLKEYYKIRKERIESKGWILIDIHYSLVYKDKIINKIIEDLKNNYNMTNDEYKIYYIKKVNNNTCPECGLKKKRVAKYCRKCFNKLKVRKRKFEVTKCELLKLISNYSFVSIGKMYNVSDNAIRKRCKKLGIQI